MVGVIDVSGLRKQLGKLVEQRKEYDAAIAKLQKVISSLTGRTAKRGKSKGKRKRANPAEMAKREAMARKYLDNHPEATGTELAKHLGGGIKLPAIYALMKKLKAK